MLIKLKSQLIDAVEYNEQRRMLRICLVDGSKRVFSEVPKSTVEDLISAQSPGNYYIDYIRSQFPRH
ncbi:KTSC domain-containing protein [Aliirhizobium smilacinae]|nr:KTSC domain-containing protein [Rhizobium smilacinae]